MNNDLNKPTQEETKIYLTPDSTLQTPEEHRHDQSVDPRKDNTMQVSNDDINDTENDKIREDMLGTGSANNEG